jgi:outer membrane immunogenic protein
MPAAPRVVKSAPIATTTWTGCYIGANIGYGRAKKDYFLASGANDGFHTADGLIAGGQIGCDYEFSNRWVVGVQGLFDWTDMAGGHIPPAAGPRREFTNIAWLGTLTGRLGYAMTPSALFYVKGGAAWVRDEHARAGGSGCVSCSTALTASGWTIGGGLEWMFKPNWSLFIEYNYMDLGSHQVTLGIPLVIDQRVQNVLVGINYRFGAR